MSWKIENVFLFLQWWSDIAFLGTLLLAGFSEFIGMISQSASMSIKLIKYLFSAKEKQHQGEKY